VLTFVVLLVLFLIGSVAGSAAAAASDSSPALAAGLQLVAWLSSAEHLEQLTSGLVSTRALAYFVFVIGAFLIVTKTAIESVRWR
jgi:hypothetical protein